MNIEHNPKIGPPQLTQGDGRLSIRDEQKLRTRDRLTDAAHEIFKEVGFRAATIDEIMKRAGSSRATFYLHFNDKVGIAAEIGRRSSVVVAESFRKLDNLVNPNRGSVHAWLENHMAERREAKVMLHIINEAISSDPQFGQEYIEYISRVSDRVFVNTLARWPEEDRKLIRSKISCLLIMLQRIQYHSICQELDFGNIDLTDTIADIIWNELFARNADNINNATRYGV